MKRIAVVTPILPVPQDMTRGRFIYETTRALSRIAKIKVFLTQARYPEMGALQPQGHRSLIADDNHRLPGIELESVTYPAFPLLSRVSNGLAAGISLKKKIEAFQPDFILGYWVYPEGAGAEYVARRLGKPIVLGALGTDINERSGLNGWLTRRTLQAADRVIFVSHAMTRHAIAHHGVSPDRCATVVNGINTDVFHPQDQRACRDELGVAPDARLIVYVGRLIEAKGLRELVTSVAKLRQADPRVCAVVIGEGDFKTDLMQQITALGQASGIQLVGGKLPPQVAKYINAADLLTLPSWTEGYPNVLVEALACGCPVVATQVGGIPEIVTPDNGVMVEPRQPDELQRGLKTALDRKWDRSAISRAMSRTWDDVARETLAVCEGLAG